jgi:hypothetical protein
MSEETEGTVAEQAVEETPAAEAEVAAEVEEQAAEVDEQAADEPVAEETAEEEPAAEEPAADEIPIPAALRREALVYLCERGHRTLILFGEPPATCNAQITRNTLCGRQVYHMTELPEQVQKALNPIKASKKKSGKK